MPKYAKWIAKGTAILALLVAMTGCGAATEPKGASNETPAQQAAPAQDSVKMKMYKMPNGKEVQIPAAPKRIVSDLYLGQLLSIGVKPIGTTGYSKIAPTVLIPYGTYNDDIRADIRAFGELLDKQAEAEAWIKQFDEKAASAREKIKTAVKDGETVGIYELRSQKFYVLGDNWGRGGQVIYNALKLTPPPAVKEVVDANTPPKLISQEVLPQFAADHMFVTTYETKQEDKDKFFGNAVYKNLPAVKNNHIYEMTFEQMYYYDPLAIEGQLDLVVEQLLAHQAK